MHSPLPLETNLINLQPEIDGSAIAGNIVRKEGKPMLHAHVVAWRQNMALCILPAACISSA